MTGEVLVLNAGSTSLRLHLVDARERARAVPDLDALGAAPRAVGHRIVHAGPDLRGHALVDDELVARVEEALPLAPLHNRAALAAMARARRLLPGVPHVAVLDTAFHADMPEAAATYAVPAEWRERWGVRRIGFHGLSVAWSAERAAALLGRPGPRLAVCHLGGGCSVTAVAGGRSLDTTMGFTPLEGVPMATRSGTVDPGVVFHVGRVAGLDASAIERALDERSGLAALAGRSGGMRAVEEAMAAGDPAARLAFDVFVHGVAGAVGRMAVAAGGLDAVVFTGGVGEGSAAVRSAVGARLAPLGVAVDAGANAEPGTDRDIAGPGAAVRVLVVAAREEVMAARAVRAVLATPPAGEAGPASGGGQPEAAAERS